MTRKEVKDCLKVDFKQTLKDISIKHVGFCFLTRTPAWMRWKFVKNMRLSSYHEELFRKGKYLHIIPMLYRLTKRNRYGNTLGLEIWGTNIGKGLTLYHNNVVINRDAKIGDFCKLHGDNCIGNDGITKDCPKIGNNVDIGVGAKILGGVTIADNVIVAAGAVVVSNFTEEGIVIGGVPARRLK